MKKIKVIWSKCVHVGDIEIGNMVQNVSEGYSSI